MTVGPPLPSSAELTLLTNEEFAFQWRVLVGEPPAIMLSDRAEMIRLLVRSMAPARGALEAIKGLRVDPGPEGDEAADG